MIAIAVHGIWSPHLDGGLNELIHSICWNLIPISRNDSACAPHTQYLKGYAAPTKNLPFIQNIITLIICVPLTSSSNECTKIYCTKSRPLYVLYWYDKCLKISTSPKRGNRVTPQQGGNWDRCDKLVGSEDAKTMIVQIGKVTKNVLSWVWEQMHKSPVL